MKKPAFLSMGKTVSKFGPPLPPSPVGVPGEPCHLIFGHNVEIRKVLMKFSVAADSLVFSPEEAEDVAAKLQYYAAAARGEKVS